MRATVRHILVNGMELAKQVMEDLDAGADFADVAQEFSACPSSVFGGELGTFEPGDTIDVFEDAIFSPYHYENRPFGPLKTEFGLHIIEITQRSGVSAVTSTSDIEERPQFAGGSDEQESHSFTEQVDSDLNSEQKSGGSGALTVETEN